MSAVFQAVGTMAAIFAGSVVVAWAITTAAVRPRRRLPLEPGTKVKLIGPSGSFRTRFLRREGSSLVFDPPLEHGRYVPIRVGESILVQAPIEGALLAFRTTVCSRDATSRELCLVVPAHFKRVERRTEPRSDSAQGRSVQVNGHPATLLDLSRHGARLTTLSPLHAGDWVEFEPRAGVVVEGWVVHTSSVALAGRIGLTLHLRFAEPFEDWFELDATG